MFISLFSITQLAALYGPDKLALCLEPSAKMFSFPAKKKKKDASYFWKPIEAGNTDYEHETPLKSFRVQKLRNYEMVEHILAPVTFPLKVLGRSQ